MEKMGAGILAIISAVVGLAVVAVIVSKNANTPNVISSAGSALSGVIGAAVAPVTGSGSGVSNGFGASGSLDSGSLSLSNLQNLFNA